MDGLSDHEILLEIRGDLKKHIEDSQETEVEITKELSKRPTRTEIVLWITGIGTVSGLFITALV